MPYLQPIKAFMQSYSGGGPIHFDIDPVPMPTPIPDYILQADRTLYTVDSQGNPNPGTTIYSIGGTDQSNMKFSVQVQYMELATYYLIRNMMFVRSPVIFCPDGLNYYQCVFDNGPLNLNYAPGYEYFVGSINLRVMKLLGAFGTVATMKFGGGGASQGNYFFAFPGQSEITPPSGGGGGGGGGTSIPPIVLTTLTLSSPDGTFWLVGVDDAGNVTTSTTTTRYDYGAILQDSLTNDWLITVNNSGVLSTSSTASAATFVPILISPGGFPYKLAVTTAGVIYTIPQFTSSMIFLSPNNLTYWEVAITTEGQLETVLVPAPLGGATTRIIASPDTTKYALGVTNLGELTTSTTSSSTTGPTYLADSGLNVWSVSVVNGGTLSTTLV